ncbi:15405_t:CDS:2 [Funneliformis caledonium]|uniref:15405_t:CDS:1 n=1 Tax=Funneliformis caledonium TaxID=1117310 RepID=A0A9N8WQI7_9GLOM|nr:15405_t:CDS:2 [Funneliformis caledonium]
MLLSDREVATDLSSRKFNNVSSSSGDNKRSSTQNSTINNLQHEEREPFTRKRRSTNGDGSSSSTKQTFTAINQILHRRASVSSQRPKDLIAEINISKIDNNKTRNTSLPSPISVNASIQQQNQPLPSHSTQHQPTLQRLLRKKSFRASRQFSPVSPLKPPFHYRQQFEEDPSNNSNNSNNNNSNLINKRIVLNHGTTTTSSSPISPINSTASSPSTKKQFFENCSREQKLLFHQTKDDKMEILLKKGKNFFGSKANLKPELHHYVVL